MNFDVELLGDCDVITNELLLRLQNKSNQMSSRKSINDSEDQQSWSNICKELTMLNEIENDEAEKLVFKDLFGSNASTSDGIAPNTDGSSPNDNEQQQKQFEEFSNTTKESDAENSQHKQILNNQKLTVTNGRRMASDYLRENSFAHLKPHMYIFHGAELSLKIARRKLKAIRKRMKLDMGLLQLEADEASQQSGEAAAGNNFFGLCSGYNNGEDDIEFDDEEDEFSDDENEDDEDIDEEESENESEDDENDNQDNEELDNSNENHIKTNQMIERTQTIKSDDQDSSGQTTESENTNDQNDATDEKGLKRSIDNQTNCTNDDDDDDEDYNYTQEFFSYQNKKQPKKA
jgi:hypothetical protein